MNSRKNDGNVTENHGHTASNRIDYLSVHYRPLPAADLESTELPITLTEKFPYATAKGRVNREFSSLYSRTKIDEEFRSYCAWLGRP